MNLSLQLICIVMQYQQSLICVIAGLIGLLVVYSDIIVIVIILMQSCWCNHYLIQDAPFRFFQN